MTLPSSVVWGKLTNLSETSYKIRITIVSTSRNVESIKFVDEYNELNAALGTEKLYNDNYPWLLFLSEGEVTCTTILHATLAERFTTVEVELPNQPVAL